MSFVQSSSFFLPLLLSQLAPSLPPPLYPFSFLTPASAFAESFFSPSPPLCDIFPFVFFCDPLELSHPSRLLPLSHPTRAPLSFGFPPPPQNPLKVSVCDILRAAAVIRITPPPTLRTMDLVHSYVCVCYCVCECVSVQFFISLCPDRAVVCSLTTLTAVVGLRMILAH